MVQKLTRPTVKDMLDKKVRGQKIAMIYVTRLEEAAAADAAGIDMLSIEAKYFSPEMREAAGRCFVQVGLPYGASGDLVTAEDYLREAFRFQRIGADCFYCAASLDIQRTLCDNRVPIVAHVGLIPSQCTWTGGFVAVGKTASAARAVFDHVKRLEAIGCFAAELEVVPDRVAEVITRSTPMLMLGMGAGPHADAQYLFVEDVLGHTSGHKPRHAKTYRDFAADTHVCSRSASRPSASSWPTCGRAPIRNPRMSCPSRMPSSKPSRLAFDHHRKADGPRRWPGRAGTRRRRGASLSASIIAARVRTRRPPTTWRMGEAGASRRAMSDTAEQL